MQNLIFLKLNVKRK